MSTPQPTAQYGHVDRVSAARAIFSSLSWAYAGLRSNPKMVAATPPTAATLKKSLRDVCTEEPPSRQQSTVLYFLSLDDCFVKFTTPDYAPGLNELTPGLLLAPRRQASFQNLPSELRALLL